MEKYNMRANFYPAKEPKMGFIGHADLFISDVIRVKGIAVFDKSDGSGHNIQFPGYDKDHSYVAPHSKEAFAQMLDVIDKAVASEKHFAFTPGKMKAELSVSGKAVDEPYADGRYSLQVGDLCTLHGITTQPVNYEKDGKEASFISVRVPNLPPYEKNGNKVYPPVFEGLKSTYEVNGEQKVTDFAQVIQAMVISERKKILTKPPLENQMENAAEKAAQAHAGNEAPAKEAER